jgi:hypothetical protein
LLDLGLGEEGIEALPELLKKHRVVEICIEESPASALASAVPWELMHDGKAYVAANPRTPIIRTTSEAPLIERFRTMRPMRILVFWACPASMNPILAEMEQVRLSLSLAPSKVD